MELPDTTSGVPLVLVRSIKIRPGGNLEVPLEYTSTFSEKGDQLQKRDIIFFV